MITIYFNIKTAQGVETVDEISESDFSTSKGFRAETSRLVREYRIAGMDVYTSSRSTKEWRAKG